MVRLKSIGVVVSRFPKFTETFVVNEILALERLGHRIEIHPLLAPEPPPHQPDALSLVERASFSRPWGLGAIRALLATLRSQPRVLARIVADLARETWRHPPFLVKDLILIPRICAVARDLIDREVDHVHAHFATHAGFAAWAIGRLTSLPYSIVAHGSDIHRNRAMLCTKLSEAAFVVTISEFNRGVIAAECGPEVLERVEVVRCGVDLAAVVAGQHPIPPVPRLLQVGTLHEVKGQRYVLEAMQILGARGRTVAATFVGDGPDRQSLESLAAELGLADRVTFTGNVSHDRVIESYGRADIMVTPSVPSSDGRKEGIPTVLMEAMASGLPVVASDLTGIPELVSDHETGLLVEPANPMAIADAIDTIITDPTLAKQLSTAGRARVESEYELDANAARVAALIAAAG